MIGLIFEKELILKKNAPKECDIRHYWYFYIKALNMSHIL